MSGVTFHCCEPFSYCYFGSIIVKTHLKYIDEASENSYDIFEDINDSADEIANFY